METTDYCDYKLSLALKAAGFDEPCRAHYTNNYVNDDPEDVSREIKFHYDWTSPYNYNQIVGSVSASTLTHAQKWLREKKGIVVIVDPDWNVEDYDMTDYLTGKWYFTVWKDGDRVHCNFDPNAEEERIWMFDKYEQALSAGISAALELFKEYYNGNQ